MQAGEGLLVTKELINLLPLTYGTRTEHWIQVLLSETCDQPLHFKCLYNDKPCFCVQFHYILYFKEKYCDTLGDAVKSP